MVPELAHESHCTITHIQSFLCPKYITYMDTFDMIIVNSQVQTGEQE